VDVDRTTFHGSPAVAIYAMDGAMVKCSNGESQTTTGTTIIAQNAKVIADGFKVKGNPSIGFRATMSGIISAKNTSVIKAGQYGYFSENMGAFIDATSATVGDAFSGFKAINGARINATQSDATGSYTGGAYSPSVNLADEKLTIIIK
ncbi:hypothetical protein FSJ14_008195, partial [Escherichia coli]|nr:hypothetical protein [Escherichia coli]